MAIPIRTTITCPSCGTSEDVTIADTSAGPSGRVSDRPILSLSRRPLWQQTRRGDDTWLSCATCGAAEFATLAGQAAAPKRAGR